MKGVKILISENVFQLELYSVLHCRHVVVQRKINSYFLAAVVYPGGGVLKVCGYYFASKQYL